MVFNTVLAAPREKLEHNYSRCFLKRIFPSGRSFQRIILIWLWLQLKFISAWNQSHMPRGTDDVLQKRNSAQLTKTVCVSKADGVFSVFKLITEDTEKTKRNYTGEH